MELSVQERYSIIKTTMETADNCLQLKDLLLFAGVSKSGYFYWLNNEENRIKRIEKDRADFVLIKEAFDFRGFKKGARSIHMRLLHNNPPVLMNLKKIRRLMKKFGLKCPIRKPRPILQAMRASVASSTAPNLLNREFETHGPRRVLLTDITYLFYGINRCYLSVIIDAFTKQVLAYSVDETYAEHLVLDTVNMLLENHGNELKTDVLLHSDQGVQYRANAFINLLKDKKLRQSMSRKGNCWDNAPQESFFGHMKDEIDLSRCKNLDDVKAVIDDWMDYYNNDRHIWELEKMAPNEYWEYIKNK